MGTTFSASINGCLALFRIITGSSTSFGATAFVLAAKFAFTKTPSSSISA